MDPYEWLVAALLLNVVGVIIGFAWLLGWWGDRTRG
jgi:hypothetical protein